VREISIGDEENLLLFTVYSFKDSKKIFWLTSSDYLEEKGEYNVIRNYTLNVKLIANGKVPKHPFSEKIEDIVSRAKNESLMFLRFIFHS
jgi:ribosomal protein L15